MKTTISTLILMIFLCTSIIKMNKDDLNYSKEEILQKLDTLSPYTFFLDLEHGYFYTSGSRITLYADKSRWAIVFEKSGYANRGPAGAIELNYYGNCLTNLDRAGKDDQYILNTKWFTLIEPKELERISSGFELVLNEIKEVKVRDAYLSIENEVNRMKQKGIDIRKYDNPKRQIDFPALVRYLEEENSTLFRASDKELKTCLPDDLPKIFHIDEWYHISYGITDGPAPSEIETFQMIADVLISRDTSKWKPTLSPNNNWRNWPKAGGL